MKKKSAKCVTRVSVMLIGALISLTLPRVFAQDDEKPSLEFLEFLGEWETKDGEWIDPMQLMNVDDKALESQSLKVKEDRSHD